MPSSHLQEMRQDHLGRLRPARQAGDGRRPGIPALRRPRQRPRRQRRLAPQALRPRLNRYRITPVIGTDPWCLRRARATSPSFLEKHTVIAAPATRALGVPLIASAGVVVNGLSVAGAFGVARLIFRDGHLAGC